MSSKNDRPLSYGDGGRGVRQLELIQLDEDLACIHNPDETEEWLEGKLWEVQP